MKTVGLLCIAACAAFAQPSPTEELILLARQGPTAPGLKDRISKVLSPRGGNTVWGQDYLFVADSATPVTISLDSQPPVAMVQVPDSSLWMLLKKMRTGVTHSFQY